MIVLRNEIFSCRPCFHVNEGQKCFHLKDKNLVSLKYSSNVQVKNTETSTQVNVKGSYRLKINTIERQPVVRRKISPQNHQNDEILFHRDLNVDTTSSIGSVIYILDGNTPIEIERFLPTEQMNKKITQGKNLSNNHMIVNFNHDGSKKNKRKTEEMDCVLIRPLGKPAKPLSLIASCSKDPVKISLYFQSTLDPTVPPNDVKVTEKLTEVEACIQEQPLSATTTDDESFDENEVKIEKKQQLKLLPNGVLQKMDEFLKDTEVFLSGLSTDSANNTSFITSCI